MDLRKEMSKYMGEELLKVCEDTFPVFSNFLDDPGAFSQAEEKIDKEGNIIIQSEHYKFKVNDDYFNLEFQGNILVVCRKTFEMQIINM